jgi:hypothetical protein
VAEREATPKRAAPPSGITIPTVPNDLLAFLRVHEETQGDADDVARLCAAAGFNVAKITADAKAWSILQERASSGALFWNVGK